MIDRLNAFFVRYFCSGDYREKVRLLTHFYSYLFWANPVEEHIYKRLVRDRLHYRDQIFCAAGAKSLYPCCGEFELHTFKV